MNRLKICGYAVMLFAMMACNKMMDVSSPNLEIHTEKASFSVGEPVRFSLSGQTDILSFWSGERGHRSEYGTGGEEINLESIQMSFNTLASNLPQGRKMECKILVSTDFSGNYKNPYELLKASWTDISQNFTIAGKYEETPSGVVDITEYRETGKPIYIALVYRCFPIATEAHSPTLQFRNFKIEGLGKYGYELIGDISKTASTAGFNIVDFSKGTDNEGESKVGVSHLVLTGTTGPTTVGNEIWAVSSAIDPFVFKPALDTPVAVKAYADELPQEFVYTYDTPGEYKAVFSAQNETASDSQKQMYEFNITITE